MVVKLTGNVNGDAVIFSRMAGDIWTSSVPATLDGVYIVDLTAYDDAGNEAYCAKYILTVDLNALCAHLAPYPYRAELIRSGYYATVMKKDCGGVQR